MSARRRFGTGKRGQNTIKVSYKKRLTYHEKSNSMVITPIALQKDGKITSWGLGAPILA
jgi:hypothetical protein